MQRISGRAPLAAAAFLAAAASFPGAALACNPFEFLFGGCRPTPAPQQRSLENLLDDQRPSAHQRRRASADGAHVRGAKQTAIRPPAGASVGSVAHFVEDQTLRNGDVVVTTDGFLVYRGHGRKHSAEDFEPLGKARNDLANLEKASRNPRQTFAPGPQPAAAPPAAVEFVVGRRPRI